MNHPILILIAAYLLDLLFGDPVYRLHPVRLIGRGIEALERILRRRGQNGFGGGIFLLAGMCLIILLIYEALLQLNIRLEWIINLYLLYSLLALKDLTDHAQRVQSALADNDTDRARAEVQMIVGRDAALLDRGGICRAAIESVAENFVDGFLSPVFWYAAGVLTFGTTDAGIAFLLIFKTVSTLDSMVGYRNERYILFGRASARTDDVLNFLPARLSIPLIAIAAHFSGLNVRRTLRIGWQDRLKHASPNSAHAEAAVAAALDIRLGGPTSYAHGTVDKPWLNENGQEADETTLARALGLIRTAALLTLAAAIAMLLIR